MDEIHISSSRTPIHRMPWPTDRLTVLCHLMRHRRKDQNKFVNLYKDNFQALCATLSLREGRPPDSHPRSHTEGPRICTALAWLPPAW